MNLESHLYLLDDNNHTFNYVYAALMQILKHMPTQAEQCCLIAHNHGKAHIKQGDIIEIQKFQQELLEKYKINTEISKTKYA
jgi:ATP-dependent Clp protease adapter protein ClpS